jgi:hypothetical protein
MNEYSYHDRRDLLTAALAVTGCLGHRRRFFAKFLRAPSERSVYDWLSGKGTPDLDRLIRSGLEPFVAAGPSKDTLISLHKTDDLVRVVGAAKSLYERSRFEDILQPLNEALGSPLDNPNWIRDQETRWLNRELVAVEGLRLLMSACSFIAKHGEARRAHQALRHVCQDLDGKIIADCDETHWYGVLERAETPREIEVAVGRLDGVLKATDRESVCAGSCLYGMALGNLRLRKRLPAKNAARACLDSSDNGILMGNGRLVLAIVRFAETTQYGDAESDIFDAREPFRKLENFQGMAVCDFVLAKMAESIESWREIRRLNESAQTLLNQAGRRDRTIFTKWDNWLREMEVSR